MHGPGFDALTRTFSEARSRRGLAQVLLGAALGGAPVLLALDDAAAKRGPHRKRRKPRDRRRRDHDASQRDGVQADRKKKKPCPPCKKRKKGKCKGKLPDGAACPGGSCQAGSCVATTPPVCTPSCTGKVCGDDGCGKSCGVCTGGLTCQNGQCVLVCNTGLTNCSGNCVDLETDADNCGECGEPCSFAHAAAACQGGTCTLGACNAGFANCDGDPDTGCETDFREENAHCGACNSPCRLDHASTRCQHGSCMLETCDVGWGDCDESAVNGCETNLQHDLDHCGTCGIACDRDTELCGGNGVCVKCDVCANGCQFNNVEAAVDAATAGDTIRICAGDWVLTSTLVIDKNLTIAGAGAEHTILDGNDAIRVLRNGVNGQEPRPITTIQDLTIAGGRATGEYEDGEGGGAFNIGTLTLVRVTVRNNIAGDRGGGIRAFGSLTLENSTVTLNRGGFGGGVAAGLGTLVLQGSVVTGNSAISGGGIFVEDGGLGTLTLIDSSIIGNSADAGSGGGLYNSNCAVTLTNSKVSGNTSTSDGGGIFTGGTISLESRTSVEDNSAEIDGGGIWNGGTMTLEPSSRVEGNSANHNGGGIYNRDTATLKTGSSVTRNSAGNEGGGFYKITDFTQPPSVESVEATDIVTDNHLTDETTVSNCAPVDTIPNCIG